MQATVRPCLYFKALTIFNLSPRHPLVPQYSVDSPCAVSMLDTGKIAEPTSASILLLSRSANYHPTSTFPIGRWMPVLRSLGSYYCRMSSSSLILLVYNMKSLRGMTAVMDYWGHSADSGDNMTIFISIVNTQTSHCDNYLFLGWSKDSCDILQYAQGFFIVDKDLCSTF